MKKHFRSLLIFAFLMSTLLLPAGRSTAAVNVSVGINTADFHFLGNYGTWIDVPGRGHVWRPRVVRGWTPYSRGEWVMTDQGWTWISDEPYGWAVYHYGDWDYEPRYGWVWAPGYEWSPARVQWIYYGDYVGWAPARVRVVDPWVNARFWHVVRLRDLNRPNVRLYALRRPLRPLRTIHVVRTAPAVAEFERVARRKVEVVRVNETEVVGGNHKFKKIEVVRRGPAGNTVVKEKVKVKTKAKTKTKVHRHH